MRTAIRARAASGYRDLLRRDTTPVLHLLLLAAALFDRLAAVAHSVTDGRHEARRLRARVAALGVRFANRRGLIMTGAVAGGANQISIHLAGPAALLGQVRRLRLVAVGGTSSIDLPSVICASAGLVRVAATVPSARFGADQPDWRLAVTDGAREIGAVVAGRSAIVGYRGEDDDGWPVRLPRGDYPALGEVADVPVHRPDSTIARVRIGYSPNDCLEFVVRSG